MTYGHLQADCLYTGISSGPNARCRVWEAFTFYLFTIKITSEFRNVGDACGDAYAMSHLSAEACTQRLAAGRGDGYQLLNGRALDGRAVRRAALAASRSR